MSKFKILVLILSLLTSICANAQTWQLKTGIKEYHKGNFEESLEKFRLSFTVWVFNSEYQSECHYWYAKAIYQTSFASNDYLMHLGNSIELNPNNIDALYLKAQVKKQIDGLSDEVIDNYIKILEHKESSIEMKNISAHYINGYKKESKENIPIESKLQAAYFYSVAVVMANMNNKNRAYKNLIKSLEMGYANYDFLWIDFDNFKHDKGLHDILNRHGVPTSFLVDKHNKYLIVISKAIRTYVENKINIWQKKGKFEKTSDYLERVTPETRIEKIDYYTQAAIDSIGMSHLRWDNLKNEYDADNESFKIIFQDFNPVYVQVPIKDAPSFDSYFNELEFNNIKFTLIDGVRPHILHMVITNSDNGQEYIYDSQDEIAFKSTQLNFNFEELDLTISDLSQNNKPQNTLQSTTIINVGKSDVDTNIPITDINNKNTYALIIGNEDYTKFQNDLNSEVNVDYARNDANIFAKYCEKTLGIPKENITILTDAISSQMNREIEKLSKLAKYSDGNATLLFYFAGHGFPDEKTKEAYIMPVDISGANVKNGIKLSSLYSKLTEFTSKKTIVILDACFSGGGRNEGLLAARSVAIKPKANPISGNILIFSSSSGQQSSLPYDNKQHGMFTYFLLKKLKDSKGDVSMEELKDYVIREVQINAVRINNKEQNPYLQISPNLENIWMDWRLY